MIFSEQKKDEVWEYKTSSKYWDLSFTSKERLNKKEIDDISFAVIEKLKIPKGSISLKKSNKEVDFIYKKKEWVQDSVDKAEECLLDFKEILEELEIRYILDGGTLLGAYRDRTFPEDDEDDIDLTTLADFDTHQEIVNRAIDKGFETYHIWKPTEKATGQIAMKRGGIKVDLMFKKLKGDKAWWTLWRGDKVETYKAVPKRFYEETKPISFVGAEFSRPKDIEEYLTLRYGNWKKPVHRSEYSCYKNDGVIVDGYEKI